MISTNFKIEDKIINNEDKYITMNKGDTLAFGVIIEDQNGAPLDVDTMSFVARKNYDDTMAIFEKTIGDGIERDSEGTYKVRVSPYDTDRDGVAVGLYYYSLRCGLNDDVYTVIKGVLEIDPIVSES